MAAESREFQHRARKNTGRLQLFSLSKKVLTNRKTGCKRLVVCRPFQFLILRTGFSAAKSHSAVPVHAARYDWKLEKALVLSSSPRFLTVCGALAYKYSPVKKRVGSMRMRGAKSFCPGRFGQSTGFDKAGLDETIEKTLRRACGRGRFCMKCMNASCFAAKILCNQRLENWGARRAAFRPYFLRSFIRGSRVRKPAFLMAGFRSTSALTRARAMP